MSKSDKRSTNRPPTSVTPEVMAIIGQVMEKDWVALRALALGYIFPDLDATALVKLAEEQKARRQSNS